MYHLTKQGKGFFSMELYRGQIKNNKRNGLGLQMFPNGAFFHGFWEQNQPSGQGRLVLPDGTFYQGEYQNGFIVRGELQYVNGAKYEGTFDSTQLERFLNGSFHFLNKFKFTGEWKEGYPLKGKLFYKNAEVADIQSQMQILRVKSGNGVLVSTNNKWLYEGGMKNKKFEGEGWIYCTFQQYKHGQFSQDKMNGHYYKMSLNWGEISKGSCEKDEKTGRWEKITNSGYCIVTEKEQTKVSFPYVNDDFYEGKVNYERNDYTITFVKGKYVSISQGLVLEEKMVQNIVNFPLQKVGFEFTYNKIMIEEKKFLQLKNAMIFVLQSNKMDIKQLPFPLSELFQEEEEEKKQLEKGMNVMNVFRQSKRLILMEEVQMAYFKQVDPSKSKSKRPVSRKSVRPQKKTALNDDKSDDKKSIVSVMPINRNSQKKSNSQYFNQSQMQEDSERFIPSKNNSKEVKSSVLPDDDSINIKQDSSNMVSIFLNDENISSISAPFRSKRRELTPAAIKKQVSYEVNMDNQIVLFEGSLVKKQKSGFCRITYKSGLFIEGIFRSGNLEGEGVMIYPNGIEHSGIFKRGFLEGAGTLTINGNLHKGRFLKGIFQGDLVHTSQGNQHYVFESKAEKTALNGTVDVYLTSGFTLQQVKFEKNKIQNGVITLVDDLANSFKGRIKLQGGPNSYIFSSSHKKPIKININLDDGAVVFN